MIDFVGIGAQKAGTTWLYKNLARHPKISFPAGKEIHFWDRVAPWDPKDWLSMFPQASDGIKQGEITPAYSTLESPTIKRIFSVAPDIKILYSIRNPIERSWSSALMGLQRAEMLEHEASDQWFIDHFLSKGSRTRSDYLSTIKRWSDVFSDSSIQVFLLEDISLNPREVLENVSVHIGADPNFWSSISEEILREYVRPMNAILKKDQNLGLKAIRQSLKPFLIDLFKSDIESLSDYLNRDLSHWLI